MAEFLRPDADVSIGGWTTQTGGTTNLFDVLNETSPDDADYIISSPDPVADIYRFRISDPTSILEDGTVRYRYEKTGSGTANLIARLIQGNASTTWNPSDLANITLSNGNLTGTGLTAEYSGARSVASESTGLKYVELTPNTIDQIAVGIANSTFNLGSNYLGENLNSIGWYKTGSIYINNSVVATVATYAQGNTLCVAVNFDSEKIWLRPASDPNWNNDVIGNQNPATNTGGISFSSLNAGPYFVAMTLDEVGVVTANFGATAYAQTPPSGATDFGDEAVIAEWEHTDIAASFVTAEQTLTTPQFDSITDFYDLFGELEASSNSAAWRNYLARTTSLGEPYASAIQELLNGLTTDGLFNVDGTSDYFDALYIYANQDTTNALLNLVSASYPCVANGSPAFTAGDGYTGTNGSTTVYLNTGFIPSTAGGLYTQNDAHFSCWNNTNSTDLCMIGATAGVGSTICAFIYPKHAAGTFFRINDDASGPVTAQADSRGHYIAVRTTSVAQQGYHNGVDQSVVSDTSTGNSDYPFYILARSNAVDSDGFDGGGQQCSAASIGGALTSGQATSFYNRLRTYMTAVGVP